MNLKTIAKTVKKILAIPIVRKTLNFSSRKLYAFFSLHPVLSSFFCFVTGSFSREIHAFVSGTSQYYERLDSANKSSVSLRRNIHRLEKGLSMIPRRDVFALDYIEETIEFYELVAAKFPKSNEVKWAHDVLQEYFTVVREHEFLNQLKKRFSSLPKPTAKTTAQLKPYAFRSIARSSVAYDDFFNLSVQRRSVRWYKDKKVERSKIDKAIKAAKLSPSACNRQPFEFRVYDEPELVQKIAHIPFGTTGYADNIKCIVVVVGDLSNYFSSRDRHVVYIDASLASMSFMYALETQGLSSCAINWPDFWLLERKMKTALSLQDYERPIMLMAVGYARDDGMVPYSEKKTLDQIRSYNKI